MTEKAGVFVVSLQYTNHNNYYKLFCLGYGILKFAMYGLHENQQV